MGHSPALCRRRAGAREARVKRARPAAPVAPTATPRWRRRLPGLAALGLHGLWLVWAYAQLLGTDRAYLWHLLLFGLCGLALAFPKLLQPRGGVRPRRIHFVLVAVVWSTLVATPLAMLMPGGRWETLALGIATWFGSHAALAGLWAWLLSRHVWPAWLIWVVTGSAALAEPQLLLVRLAAAGDGPALATLAPVLHAAYAALLAPVAVAYRQALAPAGAAAPGPGRVALAAVASVTTALLANALWFSLLRLGVDLAAR